MPASKHLPTEENQRTVLSADAAATLRLLIFTGARLRESLDLRWEHVDLERGLLLLPDSKTGRKTIVLNRAAQDVLQAHPRRGKFVIPGDDPERPRSDLKKPWAAICRHAGLVGLRIHDLRHTFASIGAGASLGLPIVGKLLGHSQPQTTARYAHLDVDPLAPVAVGSEKEAGRNPVSEQNTNLPIAGSATSAHGSGSNKSSSTAASPAAPAPGKPEKLAAAATPWETLRVGSRVLAAYWGEAREFEGFWLATVKRVEGGEFTLEWLESPEYPPFKAPAKDIAVPHPEFRHLPK